MKIVVNFKSVLYLYQDEFIQTLKSQYPESPEKIDVVQPENAPSNENLKNEEFHSQEENFQNFDSIDLENHPEIRKYLDQKYPDDPNEPKKKLIIISAMFRSGSSFMGSLFGTGQKHFRSPVCSDHDRTTMTNRYIMYYIIYCSNILILSISVLILKYWWQYIANLLIELYIVKSNCLSNFNRPMYCTSNINIVSKIAISISILKIRLNPIDLYHWIVSRYNRGFTNI